MDFSILQQFLDTNLLDVGEDEARYTYMTETAQEVAEKLQGDYSLIIPYVLVSLDPNCPSDELVLEEVEDLLKSRWKMLRQKYPDRPSQILRALILQAVDIACEQDENIAEISWLTGSSYLPFSKMQTKVAELHSNVVHHWLEKAGNVDRYTYEDLNRNSSGRLQAVKLKDKTGKSDKFNLDYLEQKWASLFTNNYNGVAIPEDMNPVPIAPQGIPAAQNIFPNQWLKEFPPRAAEFFLEYLKIINQQHEELVKATEQWLSEKQAASRGDNLRLQVIWWKQAMYSQSLKLSYRQLKSPVAAITMAFDLHEMIPSLYPVSIDYVLQENMADLLNSFNEPISVEISVTQFINAILGSEIALKIIDISYIHSQNNQRGSLLQYIVSQLQRRSQNDMDLINLVGIEPETNIALTDLTVWLFRDFQAARLAEVRE